MQCNHPPHHRPAARQRIDHQISEQQQRDQTANVACDHHRRVHMSSPHHQPRVVTQVTRSNFSTSTDKDFEKVDNKYLPNPLQGRVASLATVPSSASSGLSSFNSLTDEVTERPKANVKVSTFTPDFRFLTCQAYTGGEQLKMRLVTRHTQRGVHPPVFFCGSGSGSVWHIRRACGRARLSADWIRKKKYA